MPVRTKSFAERLNEQTFYSPDGCWLWTGSVAKGYGFLRHKKEILMVHRLSYEAHRGPVPDGLYVCHKCDVRNCINPDHLFLGTAKDNSEDRDKKGRGNNSKPGEENPQAKLSEVDVKNIFNLKAQGFSVNYLATAYLVSESCIYSILGGDRWKHLVLPEEGEDETTDKILKHLAKGMDALNKLQKQYQINESDKLGVVIDLGAAFILVEALKSKYKLTRR